MRRAFTLLELLAATALSAVLMVAVLHVLGTIGRDRGRLPEPPEAQVWRADLLDALRRDLAGSTSIRFGDNSLTLTGTSSLDRRTLAAGDEPVTVTYAVESRNGRNWLTRRQGARNGRSGDAPWTELLCPDVAAFAVRPDGVSQAAPGIAGDAPQPVPAAVVVRIELAGDKPVEQVLVVR